MRTKSKPTPDIRSIGCLSEEEKLRLVKQADDIITEVQTRSGKTGVQVQLTTTENSSVSLVAKIKSKKPTTEEIVKVLHLSPNIELEVLKRIAEKKITTTNVHDFMRVNEHHPLNTLSAAEQLAAIEDIVHYRKRLKLHKEQITISYLLKYSKVDHDLALEWHATATAEGLKLLVLLEVGHVALAHLEKSRILELQEILQNFSLLSRALSENGSFNKPGA